MMRSLLFYLIGDSVIEGLHSRLSYRFGVVDGEFRKGSSSSSRSGY